MSDFESADGPAVTVVGVPEAKRIYFYGPDDEQLHEPLTLSEEVAVHRRIENLGSLATHFGQESFAMADLTQETDDGKRMRIISQRALTRLDLDLPDNVLSFEKIDDEWRYRLGNIALAMRKQTAQDLDELHQRRSEGAIRNRARVLQRARQEAHATEAEKIDLTQYDHARITVGSTHYYLEFDSPKTILAARLCEVLGQPEVRTQIGIGGIVQHRHTVGATWAAMSLNERQLFTDGDPAGRPARGVFPSRIRGLMGLFTNFMGLTRSVVGVNGKPAHRLTISIPQVEYGLKGVDYDVLPAKGRSKVVFPPHSLGANYEHIGNHTTSKPEVEMTPGRQLAAKHIAGNRRWNNFGARNGWNAIDIA